MRVLVYLLLFIVFTFSEVAAQQSVPSGDPVESYLRLLSTDMEASGSSSFQLRGASWPLNLEGDLPFTHPWQDRAFMEAVGRQQAFENQPVRLREWRDWKLEMKLATPSASYGWNSEIPVGQDDGAMWQGRGNNLRFSVGGQLRYGPLEITLRPEFGHSQNHKFDLQPDTLHIKWPYALNTYAQGLARIDQPQRFGEEEIAWFHPGQSAARLRYRGATAGISTANFWTGPALYNPLTMSNNAPGFRHVFLGTDGPLKTPAGTVEARLFWGQLKESDYYDENPDNDNRYITGFNLSYAPFFLPELSLGLSRTLVEYYPEDGLTFIHLTRTAQRFSPENFQRHREVQFYYDSQPRIRTVDTAMHLLSFFARWAVPEEGFEIWGEWGLNENTNDRRRILREPVHTRSYVLGFQKRFDLSPRHWLAWNFEMTQIENREFEETTDYPVWYEHLYIPQGYTHEGQVLGAGIGSGSNSQKIRVDFYERRGLLGLSLNRIVHHNDRLYRHQYHIVRNQPRILKSNWNHDTPQYPSAHDISEVEYRFGFHGLVFLPYDLEVQADLYRSRVLNRHNIYKNDLYNTNLMITVRYQMPGMVR